MWPTVPSGAFCGAALAPGYFVVAHRPGTDAAGGRLHIGGDMDITLTRKIHVHF